MMSSSAAAAAAGVGSQPRRQPRPPSGVVPSGQLVHLRVSPAAVESDSRAPCPASFPSPPFSPPAPSSPSTGDGVKLRRHPLPRALHVDHKVRQKPRVAVGSRHQRERASVFVPRASRPADSVHVRFDIPRRVQRNHRAHRGHVQPPRRDVRGDQDVRLALSKRPERGGAVRLVHVAVHSRDANASCVSKRDDAPANPRATQNTNLPSSTNSSRASRATSAWRRRTRRRERPRTAPRRSWRRPVAPRLSSADRPPRHRRCRGRRTAPHQGHRRREQRRLPIGSHAVAQVPHLRLEAHVQHAVRLVEDEVGDPRQVRRLVSCKQKPRQSNRPNGQRLKKATHRPRTRRRRGPACPPPPPPRRGAPESSPSCSRRPARPRIASPRAPWPAFCTRPKSATRAPASARARERWARLLYRAPAGPSRGPARAARTRRSSRCPSWRSRPRPGPRAARESPATGWASDSYPRRFKIFKVSAFNPPHCPNLPTGLGGSTPRTHVQLAPFSPRRRRPSRKRREPRRKSRG